MAYIPDQGDIVWLDFNPSSGKEIMKRRPAFIISKKAFNRHTDMAIVAPITSTVRGTELEVALTSRNSKVQGAILVYQLKSLDFTNRNIEFIEKASHKIIQQVSSIAQVLVE